MNAQILQNDTRLIRRKLIVNDKKKEIISRIPPILEILSCFYSYPHKNFFFVKSSNNLSINFFNLNCDILFYLNIILHIKYMFMPYFMFCADYFLYKIEKIYFLINNFSSLLLNLRINIHSMLSKNLILPSQSKLFLNTL